MTDNEEQYDQPTIHIFSTFPVEDNIVLGIGLTTIDYSTGQALTPDGVIPLAGRLPENTVFRSVMFVFAEEVNIEILLDDQIQFKGFIPAGRARFFDIKFDSINITTVIGTTTEVIATTYVIPPEFTSV